MGLVANVVAIFIVIVYSAKDITPAMREPVKQRNGLGKVVSEGCSLSHGVKLINVDEWSGKIIRN